LPMVILGAEGMTWTRGKSEDLALPHVPPRDAGSPEESS
jgi:hypothetical protein